MSAAIDLTVLSVEQLVALRAKIELELAARASGVAATAPAPRATHTLELEQIGGAKAWVAEITGKDSKYGLKRAFVDGVRDHSGANSVGSRGVTTTYTLKAGRMYEINSPRSWKKTDRYFAAVDDAGALVEISAADVQTRFA